MRKRKLFIVLLMALLPFTGWAQLKNYYGQHVSIKRTTGDSIQYDLRLNYNGFKPIVRDGKVVWSFLENTNEIVNGYWLKKEKFAIDNVESIDFRSKKCDSIEARKALIEFYHALDGDNWPHKDNWCSDKPINEWYGINVDCMDDEYQVPWVQTLDLTDFFFNQWDYSPGSLPECVSRMGPIESLRMPNFMLKGSIPEFLGNIYSLYELDFYGCQLSGTIPVSIAKLPHLNRFDIQWNMFEGQLPEEFLCNIMDRLPGSNINFNLNFFSGKIPEGIVNHPQFCDFWPALITQRGEGLDLSDLKIPAPTFTTKDINGNTINLKEEYKKHKYTLLYKWGLWCNISEEFNKKLVPVCKAYKDKGLEVIGIHYDLSGDDGLADYLKDHDIPWNNAISNDWYRSGTAEGRSIFQWDGTPHVFLVDQEGAIVFHSLRDEKGNVVTDDNRKERLFPLLDKLLGPIEYNFYTSTDYSLDGTFNCLQTATTGEGVDLVFVGEGFTDKDIAEGTFDQRMNEALTQFFAYEPYFALRDRFNVYAVKAVSPNAEFFGSNSVHAIDEDVSKALEYASKVQDLIPNRPMHVVVVYNNNSGGRSYCTMMEDDSFVCFAMDGVSTVLNHEAGGHGFGKLFDEYVENGYENLALPEEEKTEMENMWTTLGWGANVDWRSNPAEVKWAKFINDERYADERIGVYEGSYLYGSGAYRPTENSMMRNNDVGFNAPSREEIYKRVMKESEGEGWTYDYDTFVAFDASAHEEFVSAMSKSKARGEKSPQAQPALQTAPPVFLKGTWRDALKKNKK